MQRKTKPSDFYLRKYAAMSNFYFTRAQVDVALSACRVSTKRKRNTDWIVNGNDGSNEVDAKAKRMRSEIEMKKYEA